MQSSVTSVFSEPEGFRLAMGSEGALRFTVTRRGRFRAQLVQVALDRLRLSAVEETLPRIALVRVPRDRVLISFSLGAASPIWGGVSAQPDELLTVGSGMSVHARTEASSHWGAIWFPTTELARYSRALTGKSLHIPQNVCRWRPATAAIRLLLELHRNTVAMARNCPQTFTASAATHGLEQQFIHAVIECLSDGPVTQGSTMRRRRQQLLARIDDLLTIEVPAEINVPAICRVLDVSNRFLRRCCDEQLGMSAADYLRLRRLQSVHSVLRNGFPHDVRVSETAQRHGVRNYARFVAAYRDLFGEPPSATLRREPVRRMPDLISRRRARLWYLKKQLR